MCQKYEGGILMSTEITASLEDMSTPLPLLLSPKQNIVVLSTQYVSKTNTFYKQIKSKSLIAIRIQCCTRQKSTTSARKDKSQYK